MPSLIVFVNFRCATFDFLIGRYAFVNRAGKAIFSLVHCVKIICRVFCRWKYDSCLITARRPACDFVEVSGLYSCGRTVNPSYFISLYTHVFIRR